MTGIGFYLLSTRSTVSSIPGPVSQPPCSFQETCSLTKTNVVSRVTTSWKLSCCMWKLVFLANISIHHNIGIIIDSLSLAPTKAVVMTDSGSMQRWSTVARTIRLLLIQNAPQLLVRPMLICIDHCNGLITGAMAGVVKLLQMVQNVVNWVHIISLLMELQWLPAFGSSPFCWPTKCQLDVLLSAELSCWSPSASCLLRCSHECRLV